MNWDRVKGTAPRMSNWPTKTAWLEMINRGRS